MIMKAGETNLFLYADDLKLYREIKADEEYRKITDQSWQTLWLDAIFPVKVPSG